jgi:hypothetical protein
MMFVGRFWWLAGSSMNLIFIVTTSGFHNTPYSGWNFVFS